MNEASVLVLRSHSEGEPKETVAKLKKLITSLSHDLKGVREPVRVWAVLAYN
jgi:hypothetical protein